MSVGIESCRLVLSHAGLDPVSILLLQHRQEKNGPRIKSGATVLCIRGDGIVRPVRRYCAFGVMIFFVRVFGSDSVGFS